jgi:hypothetical protein
MSAIPPVCHIPPVTPTTQPSPLNLPSIPPAVATLQSLAATVNAMRQVVIVLAGQQGRPGVPGPQGQPGKSSKGTWSETSRAEETVKIYQNNDPSTGNFVEVKQINKLVMSNKDTGQNWTWNR